MSDIPNNPGDEEEEEESEAEEFVPYLKEFFGDTQPSEQVRRDFISYYLMPRLSPNQANQRREIARNLVEARQDIKALEEKAVPDQRETITQLETRITQIETTFKKMDEAARLGADLITKAAIASGLDERVKRIEEELRAQQGFRLQDKGNLIMLITLVIAVIALAK